MRPESYGTCKRLLAKGCYFPNIDIKEYVGQFEIYDRDRKRLELATLVRIKEKGKWYVRLHLSTIIVEKGKEEEQKTELILLFLQETHLTTHLGKVNTDFDMLDTCQISEEERLKNIITNYKPMIVETKFNLGEEAYVIVSNKSCLVLNN